MIEIVYVGNSHRSVTNYVIGSESASQIKMSVAAATVPELVSNVGNVQTISNGRLSSAIHSLPDDTVVVKMPIPVVVEYHIASAPADEDEFVVVFPATGIAMSGDTVREAMQGFKEEIAQSYHLYKNEMTLGPEPARRLQILEQYIGEKGGEQTPT